jgi:transcriptional regulator with XRE-family HTH domain
MNERFKELLETIEMSNEKIAQHLGIDVRTFYRLKNGSVKKIDINVIYALRTKFNVDLNWLFGTAGNDSSKALNINESLITEGKEAITEGKYISHLEDENRWLREKYDELLNRQKHEEGKQEQGRSFG